MIDRRLEVLGQEVISRLRGSPTFRHITFEDDFKKAEEAINRQDVLVVMHFQNHLPLVRPGVPRWEVQLLLDARSNTAQILTVCPGKSYRAAATSAWGRPSLTPRRGRGAELVQP